MAAMKSTRNMLWASVAWLIRAELMRRILWSAYNIRLFAIKSYGLVIHEFDPWFNFRATQYMADNGIMAFFKWYDYMSWYPLGRPVGTTTYPGMQIVSVLIWRILNEVLGITMSLNDVCCYVPAWFGAIATLFLGLVAWECSGSANAGVAAAAVMAIIPAHIMRSVGGGYDNESVAMTAMLMTFYFWNRATRSHGKFYGVLAGLSYTFMVAAWGGYIFVINMVGVHAAALVALGYFNDNIYWAYSIMYLLGTFGATRVPVVGLAPIKSLEQLGPAAVFIGYQLLQLCAVVSRRRKHNFFQRWQFRMQVFSLAAVGAAMVVAALWPTGYFGPLSSRVRGLFVKHTRTGNPLVDSVAEHQPANEQAYRTYLHSTYWIAPYGFAVALLSTRGSSRFLLLWSCTVLFFANKMMRLILLTGPVASALTGVALGVTFDFAAQQFLNIDYVPEAITEDDRKREQAEKDILKGEAKTGSSNANAPASSKKNKKAHKKAQQQASRGGGAAAAASTGAAKDAADDDKNPLKPLVDAFNHYSVVVQKLYYTNKVIRTGRRVTAGAIVLVLFHVLTNYGSEFWTYSHHMAEQLSSPSIMFHAQLRDGTKVTVDDYREAYWWLRDNTPEDSRVMAWWDYGYQITGIANRTTIADGNTWNHEHIATLGRCLTSPEKEAHRIVRHLADYLLVWTGGGGDDLAKSPHMARIGNSVFNDICPGDPTCSQFGFYKGGQPTPMMEESLLYKLHSHMMRPGVQVDPNRFKEVFRSRFGKVRIYQVLKVSKESKEWVADPANRVCDAPGSWYCVGQYPPALHKLIARRRNFAQLEDFNAGGGDDEYTREYMARMSGQKKGSSKPGYNLDQKQASSASSGSPPNPEEVLKVKKRSKKWAESVVWEDTEETTLMWQLIQKNDASTLASWLTSSPDSVHMRSADGRGPLWWANEYKRKDIIDLLYKFKVRDDLADSQGKLPSEA